MTTRLARRLLMPLVPLYAGVVGAKNWLTDRDMLTRRRLGHPVISVGSISAGGAGKTPVVMLLADLLLQRGFEVRVLTRGYRRNSLATLRVDPAGDAREAGDEPMLMARRLPGATVWVGSDRYRAGSLSEQDEALESGSGLSKTVYLLDDGFQHRKLRRDVDIALVTQQDVEDGLLPAGNLREPLTALGRADIVIVRADEAALAEGLGAAQVWAVTRRLVFPADLAMPLRPLVFCGLARPEGFLSMLASSGVVAAGVARFRDHHPYSARDVEGLVERAQSSAADGFVTTEKDAVKLSPAMIKRLAQVGPVVAPELRVELIDEQARLEELVALIHRCADPSMR